MFKFFFGNSESKPEIERAVQLTASEAKKLADNATEALSKDIQDYYNLALVEIQKAANRGFHEVRFYCKHSECGPILREIAERLRKLGYGVYSVSADFGDIKIDWTHAK